MLRVVVPGGRALENPEGIFGKIKEGDSPQGGWVLVGVRALSEGGRVGDFSREEVGLRALF